MLDTQPIIQCSEINHQYQQVQFVSQNNLYCCKCVTIKNICTSQLLTLDDYLQKVKIIQVNESNQINKMYESQLIKVENLYDDVKKCQSMIFDSLEKIKKGLVDLKSLLNIQQQDQLKYVQLLTENLNRSKLINLLSLIPINKQEIQNYQEANSKLLKKILLQYFQETQYFQNWKTMTKQLKELNKNIYSKIYNQYIEAFNYQFEQDIDKLAIYNKQIVFGFRNQISFATINENCEFQIEQSLDLKFTTITCLVFMKNQKYLIRGGTDRLIKIIENDGHWKTIQELNDHQDQITDLILLHSQQEMISGSVDKTIRIWVQSDQKFWICSQILNLDEKVMYLELNKSNQIFAASCSDGSISFYNRFVFDWMLFTKYEYKQISLQQISLSFCFCDESEVLIKEIQPISKIKSIGVYNYLQTSSELILPSQEEFEDYSFKMIFLRKKQLLICRQNNFIYIIFQNKFRKFQLLQAISGEFDQCIALSKNTKLLFLSKVKKKIQIYEKME